MKDRCSLLHCTRVETQPRLLRCSLSLITVAFSLGRTNSTNLNHLKCFSQHFGTPEVELALEHNQMWQVLLAAAAVAGSGILAKKLMSSRQTVNTDSDIENSEQESGESSDVQPQDSIFIIDEVHQGESSQENEWNEDGGIFRFSSSQTSHELKKRNGRKVKKNGGWLKKGTKGSAGSGVKELAVDQGGSGSRRRVSVCLKKRKIGKYVAGKCESCAFKDHSFSKGVGLGMTYMMSVGKAEISRLNNTVNETAKVVRELKAEIMRRKSSSHKTTFVDGESATCRVHEEQSPELLEMDRLEAELESELQKLPWRPTESSCSEVKPELFEAEDSTKDHDDDSNIYPCYGIPPALLDKKLCRLVMGQQESQILELESELQQANRKLHEKEVELQALKNCAKRLSEFSISGISDVEIDGSEEEVNRSDCVEEQVGMKLALGCKSYSCSSE